MGQVDSDLRKKGTKSGVRRQKSERFNEARFVNYELDKAQQEACKHHAVNADWVFDQLLTLTGDGYSFGVRFDRYSQAYAAFMQLRDTGGINEGLILTGRGSTPFKALKQLLYKHFVCLDGDWRDFAEHRSNSVIDD